MATNGEKSKPAIGRIHPWVESAVAGKIHPCSDDTAARLAQTDAVRKLSGGSGTMTLNNIILFVGIAALAIFTQVGRRPVTVRRFLIPVAAVGYAAFHYLQTIPTVGGDLDFEAALTLVGVAFGLLAAYAVRVERDANSGRIMMQAGL